MRGDDRASSSVEVKFGLCDACRFQRIVSNTRGSSFSLCERSKIDPRFAKYPPVPVARCAGYEPRA